MRFANHDFPALPSILSVENLLGDVLGEHVYVGGACVGFYVDDPAAAEIRPTYDVDIVVEIASEVERTQHDERLRQAGLQHDQNGPICRWTKGGLVIDVMPSSPEILGFSNRWYPYVLASPVACDVDGVEIQIASLSAFLATKMEAFSGRGGDDYVTSSDFEDIVRICDGCLTFEVDCLDAASEVLEFIGLTAREWLDKGDEFRQAVSAHIEQGDSVRTQEVLARLQLLASQKRSG